MKTPEEVMKEKAENKKNVQEYEKLTNEYLKVHKMIEKNVRRYAYNENEYVCKHINMDDLINCTIYKALCHKRNTFFRKCKCRMEIIISEDRIKKVKSSWSIKFHQNPELLDRLKKIDYRYYS